MLVLLSQHLRPLGALEAAMYLEQPVTWSQSVLPADQEPPKS